MDTVYIETSIVSHATAWPSPDPATAVLQDQAKRWMVEQRRLYTLSRRSWSLTRLAWVIRMQRLAG